MIKISETPELKLYQKPKRLYLNTGFTYLARGEDGTNSDHRELIAVLGRRDSLNHLMSDPLSTLINPYTITAGVVSMGGAVAATELLEWPWITSLSVPIILIITAFVNGALRIGNGEEMPIEHAPAHWAVINDEPDATDLLLKWKLAMDRKVILSESMSEIRRTGESGQFYLEALEKEQQDVQREIKDNFDVINNRVADLLWKNKDREQIKQ